MPTTKIYMCVFCDTQITSGNYCITCNEYKGVMLKKEWQQFNLENPKMKVGA